MQDQPIRLMRFETAVRRDQAIDAWFEAQIPELGGIARQWFGIMRGQGDDVRELLHDGHPTACIGDAAFGYVNAFTAHVNIGFFLGAWLDDPTGILEGTGKRMRHVKVRPVTEPNAAALTALIETSYCDMKRRLQAGVR